MVGRAGCCLAGRSNTLPIIYDAVVPVPSHSTSLTHTCKECNPHLRAQPRSERREVSRPDEHGERARGAEIESSHGGQNYGHGQGANERHNVRRLREPKLEFHRHGSWVGDDGEGQEERTSTLGSK